MWRWISNEIKFTMVFVIVLLLFILIIIKYLLQLKYWIVTYIIHQLKILDNKLNLSFLVYWRGEFEVERNKI